MRVIVVGGGIAGLSAAIGLRRGGHDVVVLEQAPRIDPVGAGITLFANAMRALDRVGERFGLVDIGRGRTYWFATKNAPERELNETREGKAEILRRFSGWHEPIAAVGEATDEDAILRNDVYYIEPLPRWSSGRVVLVGDAAHATTPGVGQGAAQAIEDAVVLVDRLAGTADVFVALAQYEVIRRPRAEAVLRMSRRVDKAAQLASPLGRRIRNMLVRRLPERAQRRQLEPLARYELEPNEWSASACSRAPVLTTAH